MNAKPLPRLFRYVALVLGTIGLGLLYLTALHRENPAVCGIKTGFSRFRLAKAMTTALSPLRMTLTSMIFKSPRTKISTMNSPAVLYPMPSPKHKDVIVSVPERAEAWISPFWLRLGRVRCSAQDHAVLGPAVSLRKTACRQP